jgi:integrase/recombinase XerD
MRRLLTPGPESLRQFLQMQHFRHQCTPKVYASILRDFQHFVLEHSGGEPLSISIVQRWLESKILQWPLHIVYHRARLVDRYLGWMEKSGAGQINPFSELRHKYGKRTTPIVRALLSKDVNAALERLRPLPRFGSFLGKVMEEHVAHMRSIGYRYDTNECKLRRFDRFLQQNTQLSGAPLYRLVEAWCDSNPSAQHFLEAQQVARVVSKAMHRHDANVTLLPALDVRQRRPQRQRQPYIYTEEEIERILQTARTFPSPKAPLRPLSLYTMLALAYCAGLRIGEVVRLTVGDVNVEDGTIEIRDTKFFKSRRLPLAPTVVAALRRYLLSRQEVRAPVTAGSALFWNERLRQGYAYGTTHNLLVEVLRRAGVKPARAKIGPRIHDLRHAMACNRMLKWYRDGINPQSRLPYLATYLGHTDIKYTLAYLNVSQEVLLLASERVRQQHGTKALGVSGVQP